MADSRSPNDIQSELDLLESWSEQGAPRLDSLQDNLRSLMDSTGLDAAEGPGEQAGGAEPAESDASLSGHLAFGEPGPLGRARAGRRRRPRRFSWPLLGLALLAAAGSVFLFSRWDAWKPRQAPRAEGPSEAPELQKPPSPLAQPSAVVSLVPGAERSPQPAAEASPAEEMASGPSVEPSPAEAVAPPPEAAHGGAPDGRGGEKPSASLEQPGAAEGGRTSVHRVKVGDSLYGIAREHLGDGDRWPEIYALNRSQLTTPALIRPGQTLSLPPSGGEGAAAQAATRPAARYVTVPGDSLTAIAAARLGAASRWREIYELNRSQLRDPSLLPVGLSLVLPAEAGPAARAAGRATFSYVVRPGDTLALLARRYLGDAARWNELWVLNRARVPNPARLYPGQRLRIPQRVGAARPARYVVKAGDTLWAIAASQTGRAENWQALWAANRQVSDPRRLPVGEVLVLPF